MRPDLSIAAATVLAAHALLASAPAHAETEPRPGLSEQTHAFFMPTGNTLRAGQTAVRSHGLFIYNQLAVGLTDHIEINISAPIVPYFASAGLRIQLLPRTSPLRLLVTGGLWRGLIESEEAVASSSITIAYQSDTSNLHLTAGIAKSMVQDLFADGYGSSDPIGVASAGAVIGSDRYAFFVELGTLAELDQSREYVGGLQLGVKIMRERYDVDLGILVPAVNTESAVVTPFLSTNYRL